MKICADALTSESGARYGAILPFKSFPRNDVTTTMTMMYTIFDEEFSMGPTKFPRESEDFKFAKMFYEMTEKLVAERKLKTHPAVVKDRGLHGAVKGMEDMKAGKLSGEKWVYKVDETK